MRPQTGPAAVRDLAGYVDALQAQGRYTFTRDEALTALGCSEVALKQAAHRLVLKHRLAVPRRGFFVVVPLEYRSAGAPPASWFIDALMKFEERPYYVGLLTASAIHGAAHQAPQEFQVLTNAAVRGARAGRDRLRFFIKRDMERSATSAVKTETGTMLVSTPEVTAFDLVRYAHASGGVGHVATVIAELTDALDAERLFDAAEAGVDVAAAQRLGFLLEHVGAEDRARRLQEWVAARNPRLVRLRPDLPGDSAIRDHRWHLVVNDEIEVDV